LEGIAGEGRKIEVRLERPGVYHLAALLLDGRQRDEVTHGGEVRLFGEFALRGDEQIGAGLGEALGDRPRPVVFLRPKRPARMRKQHFERVPAAERQQTGADLCTAAHPRTVLLKLRLSTAG